jgi:hypothetical protein
VEREDGLYVDIEGVRRKDCTRLLDELLALDAVDYEVAYFPSADCAFHPTLIPPIASPPR